MQLHKFNKIIGSVQSGCQAGSIVFHQPRLSMGIKDVYISAPDVCFVIILLNFVSKLLSVFSYGHDDLRHRI